MKTIVCVNGTERGEGRRGRRKILITGGGEAAVIALRNWRVYSRLEIRCNILMIT